MSILLGFGNLTVCFQLAFVLSNLLVGIPVTPPRKTKGETSLKKGKKKSSSLRPTLLVRVESKHQVLS